MQTRSTAVRTQRVLFFAALASAAAAPARGAAQIKVSVALSGKAPAMKPLNRTSDPFCAKTKMSEEEVLSKGGMLENALVRVVKGAPAAAGTGDVAIQQHQCMYRPRVSGAVGGQTVVVKNGDQTLHNVHTYKGQSTVFNRAQPPGTAEVKHELKAKDNNSVIKFKCDVHPWMTAYIVVNDNPYFGVTNAKGEATLAGVPPGTYTVETWHERFGVKTADVTVAAGKPADVKVTYTGDEPKPAL